MTAPRVTYSERELSNYILNNGTINVGYVLPTKKGKKNTPIFLSDGDKFLRMFTPNDTIEASMSSSHFSILKILSKAGVWLVSPKPQGSFFAGIRIGSETPYYPIEYKSEHETESDESFTILASSEGDWGNKLSISIMGYKEAELVNIDSDGSFTTIQQWGDGFPVKVFLNGEYNVKLDEDSTYFIYNKNNKTYLTSSQSNLDNTIITLPSSQLVHIMPAIEYTKIPNTFCIRVHTGKNHTVKRSYIVSKKQIKSDDNNSLFIEDVVNDEEYISIINNPLNTKLHVDDIVFPKELTGGYDGEPVTPGDMIRALKLLGNKNLIKITMIGDGGYTSQAFQAAIAELCEQRGDCVGFLSIPINVQSNPDTAAQSIVNLRKFTLGYNTSWAALYAPHQVIYDEYNDRNVLIAPDCFAIGAVIDTASNYEAWYPAAGLNRGIINSLDCNVRFTDKDQDLLYDAGINPIVFDPDRGIKIWGQKTLRTIPSMTDRLNVRMLLVTIAPAITSFLESYLFEFNDEYTDDKIVTLIESYMEGIKGRRGVQNYKVLTNRTTASDIDNHIKRVDLLICPNSSIEYIPFTIGIANNQISFDTITL